MTPHQIGNLILKSFGIYAFLRAIEYLPSLAYQLFGTPNTTQEVPRYLFVTLQLLLFFALIFIAIALFFFGKRFAEWLVEPEESGNTLSRLSADELERVVFSGIGLFVLIQSLPHLSRLLAPIFFSERINLNWTSDLISAALMIAVGVWLLLRSEGLIALLNQIRNRGTES